MIAEVSVQMSIVVGLLMESGIHLLLQTWEIYVVVIDLCILVALELLAFPFIDLQCQSHLVGHSVLVISKGCWLHWLLS